MKGALKLDQRSFHYDKGENYELILCSNDIILFDGWQPKSTIIGKVKFWFFGIRLKQVRNNGFGGDGSVRAGGDDLA